MLTGLWLIAPVALNPAVAGAQSQPEAAVHQNTNASGTVGRASPHLRLAKVIVLKNELRERAGSDDLSQQSVAPRLQSRIKKNSQFAAFVKLVRATSKRQYTAEELQKLYLKFKAWSYQRNKQDR
ncbi:MAG: hypothetical protein AAGA00_14185 [Pseudomonadota bacterium]